MAQQLYVGIDKDEKGGLTHLGRMVRDAWVFGILPETETCTGWDFARMQNLYDKVYAAWEPYAHIPSRLPDDLRERHTRMYAQAIKKAHDTGWDAELGEDE
ncbi:MAG: hypothetical protein Q8K43_00960 [Sulfurimicrobium sp.]|jgi:hypothetical protein|nr:hypothetical protein [Sulfurimicrobium sp.]MDO9189940.1 hypothetical protein [Sulfurimicrobium sp.]MDP1705093.1 hypothetical protein [Sulfurimicrobium sp.]MDP1896434.1 hypothetical protein [Sulfurimicrobium sp.]MDP2198733.1 hypothetical protein [Sulfurimicrobium sp.]